MEDCEAYCNDLIKGGKPSAATSFVRKLYNLVSCESEEVVSFTPDGTAFEVKDPKKLEAEILPKYFRHSRFQSFVRQLNFYNFKKTNKERSMWIYKHELFRRDRPDLLDKLKRKTSCGDTRRLQRSISSDSAIASAIPPRNASWAALVKSSSESFLQLSGELSGDENDSPSQSPIAEEELCAPLPPRVPLDLSSLQQVPRTFPEHLSHFHVDSAKGSFAPYNPSPSGVATSLSPKFPPSPSPRPMNLGSHLQVPPPIVIQRKRSAEAMQMAYTDDEEDDGGETDVSSGSSWETSRSTRTKLTPHPEEEEAPALGAFAETPIDETFLRQIADVLRRMSPDLSSVAMDTVYFIIQFTVLAVQDPEQVRNDVIKFIFDHSDVNEELRNYRVALDPSLFYVRNAVSPKSLSTMADPIAHRLLQTQGCFDRSRVVRDFIAFGLMHLQSVADLATNDPSATNFRRLLDDSHRLWRRTAASLS